MMSGWYCPHCNAHHSPLIDTCPRQNGARLVRQHFDRSEFPPGYQYGAGACGCASPKCRAEGCQSRKQTADAAWRSYDQRHQSGAVGSAGLLSRALSSEA